MKYRIVNAHKTFCSPEWTWHNSGTDIRNFVLWVVMSGEGRVVGDMGRFDIRPGMCILWRCRQKHLVTHNPKNPLVVPWILFEYLDESGQPYIPKKIPSFLRSIKDMEFLAELMRRSIESHLTANNIDAVYWLDVCLHEMGNYDLALGGQGKFAMHYGRIDSTCRLITENPFHRFTLEQLAEHANLSIDHLIRIFRKSKGITPGEFILRHRMQTACDLLKFTDNSITQIAEKMGYPNIYSFSRQFHERLGMSPSAYRYQK